ncbi:MAG: hypothetical protein Q7K54_01520 [Candidatus Parcubacteria bacterium]|nr:hypothetical protein [Candidatus Parcubacteria bacterium]
MALQFLKKLENKIRGKLSHHPVVYAFIGGIGIVLFWRGIWHTADAINLSSILSLIMGAVILIITGIFVSEFLGTKLIMSDISGEKKLVEKEEIEIETEESKLKNLQNTLERVEEKLDHLEEEMGGK